MPSRLHDLPPYRDPAIGNALPNDCRIYTRLHEDLVGDQALFLVSFDRQKLKFRAIRHRLLAAFLYKLAPGQLLNLFFDEPPFAHICQY